MTARRKATTNTRGGAKRLGLAKKTLKDLSARRSGPNGGFIMQDTIIIPTGRRR